MIDEITIGADEIGKRAEEDPESDNGPEQHFALDPSPEPHHEHQPTLNTVTDRICDGASIFHMILTPRQTRKPRLCDFCFCPGPQLAGLKIYLLRNVSYFAIFVERNPAI